MELFTPAVSGGLEYLKCDILFLLKQESSLVLSCEMMKWEVLEKADGQAAGVTFH